MSVTKEQVLAQLSTINDPDLNRDIVSLGFVTKAAVCDGVIDVVDIALESTYAKAYYETFRELNHERGKSAEEMHHNALWVAFVQLGTVRRKCPEVTLVHIK